MKPRGEFPPLRRNVETGTEFAVAGAPYRFSPLGFADEKGVLSAIRETIGRWRLPAVDRGPTRQTHTAEALMLWVTYPTMRSCPVQKFARRTFLSTFPTPVIGNCLTSCTCFGA